MKYWKGKTGTAKDGQMGTMDDNGSVIDAVFISQAEYDVWLSAQPKITPTDYKTLYTAAATDSQRLAVIAQALFGVV